MSFLSFSCVYLEYQEQPEVIINISQNDKHNYMYLQQQALYIIS